MMGEMFIDEKRIHEVLEETKNPSNSGISAILEKALLLKGLNLKAVKLLEKRVNLN